MTADEAAEFDVNLHQESCVRLRRYVDMREVRNMATRSLHGYESLIRGFLKRDVNRITVARTLFLKSSESPTSIFG
ncbi:MAG: hypothetical protein WCK86_03905 [Planctomycetia bacterium]